MKSFAMSLRLGLFAHCLLSCQASLIASSSQIATPTMFVQSAVVWYLHAFASELKIDLRRLTTHPNFIQPSHSPSRLHQTPRSFPAQNLDQHGVHEYCCLVCLQHLLMVQSHVVAECLQEFHSLPIRSRFPLLDFASRLTSLRVPFSVYLPRVSYLVQLVLRHCWAKLVAFAVSVPPIAKL